MHRIIVLLFTFIACIPSPPKGDKDFRSLILEDGVYKSPFDNGSPYSGNCFDEAGNYQTRVENGIVMDTVKIYENGVLFECYTMKDNKLNGLFTTYCENGEKIYSVHYLDGKSDGDSIYYSCSKKVLSICQLKMGKLNGLSMNYYPNSDQIQTRGNFVNDTPCGKWITYLEDGDSSIVEYFDCKE